MSEKIAYAVGPKGQILALSLEDGSVVWKRAMADFQSTEPRYGWTTSPLIVGKNLIVQTGGTKGMSVSALRRADGATVWSTGDDTVNYQSPTLAEIHGETQLICAGDHIISGLNPETGEERWSLTHDGRGEDTNPVLIGENRIFIRHQGNEGMALSVDRTENGFTAREIWKSRELKNTNNPSLALDGHLYGFSGAFLTCVKSADGTLGWRSRRPGDGFTIMVNDYLVTITKRGTLHLGPAHAEKYEDVANVRVLQGLGWTPPSYANGRIFVRNLSEIACVKLSGSEPVVQIAPPERQGSLPQTKFGSFIAALEKAENKAAMIDGFFEKHKSFPIIEDGKYAHVVYRGEAQDVAIQSDLLFTGENVPMNHVGGSDFYYFSFEAAPDAFVGYSILKDFEQVITDPLNPRRMPTFGPDESLLAMPEAKVPGTLPDMDAMQGEMVTLEFPSKVMENQRTLQIYLPPGYADSPSTRYPVIYAHYGQDAVDKMHLPQIMDRMIGGKMKPVIGVFIHLNADNGYREISGELKEKYMDMVVEELVPYIDQHYRTIARADQRVSMGQSAAGFLSILMALKYPQVWGGVGSQSTNADGQLGAEIMEAVEQGPASLKTRFFVHWGRYDVRTANGEVNRMESNQRLFEAMKARGYSVSGGLMSHGYGWGKWAMVAPRILETLFPLKQDIN